MRSFFFFFLVMGSYLALFDFGFGFGVCIGRESVLMGFLFFTSLFVCFLFVFIVAVWPWRHCIHEFVRLSVGEKIGDRYQVRSSLCSGCRYYCTVVGANMQAILCKMPSLPTTPLPTYVFLQLRKIATQFRLCWIFALHHHHNSPPVWWRRWRRWRRMNAQAAVVVMTAVTCK